MLAKAEEEGIAVAEIQSWPLLEEDSHHLKCNSGKTEEQLKESNRSYKVKGTATQG